MKSKKEPVKQVRKKTFLFSDIFAGIGGFRIAFRKAGYSCIYSLENNKYCRETYVKNFHELPENNIEDIDINAIPRHDVLIAGFPCQPFSISGKLKGFEDTRGTLIYYVLKIIKERQPKVVLLENVKHLKYHDKGNTLKKIIHHLEELNYYVSWQILNASDFGVPQNRERVIIIGCKKKYFDFSKIKFKSKVILKNFLDKNNGFEYLNEPYTLIENPVRQESGLIFIGHRNKKIRTNGVRPGTEHLSRVHKQPNRIYSSEGLHPTLPSQESAGRFWIFDDGKVRKLTINECYKIMGFPKNFKRISPLSEQYRQIGNSVCVPMIFEIAKQIKEQLL